MKSVELARNPKRLVDLQFALCQETVDELGDEDTITRLHMSAEQISLLHVVPHLTYLVEGQ